MNLKSTLQFTVEIPVYPERVYRAWLDSYEHGQFTGQPANIQAEAGGRFITLSGQVKSSLIRLVPHSSIEQTWQIEDFPLESDSSILLTLQPTCTGCEVRLQHRGVPLEWGKKLLRWWEEQYFRPLKAYFEAIVGDYVADMGDG
ncbi:MAG: SRPBCC domain-containing protein [Chloroflexota bacterium]|nr:MAG: hypothetical protein KatS3mg047_0101 [Bellilinea sp.]